MSNRKNLRQVGKNKYELDETTNFLNNLHNFKGVRSIEVVGEDQPRHSHGANKLEVRAKTYCETTRVYKVDIMEGELTEAICIKFKTEHHERFMEYVEAYKPR